MQAAVGYALWLGLLSLASGALAFALAPFVGRGSAAGVAGAVMFGGFIINGYQAAIPAIAPLANLSWFGWTSNHIPLAGVFDWASLVPVALVAIVLLVVGVEAFARRDIGATSPIPTPSLPRALLGLRGPTGRAFGRTCRRRSPGASASACSAVASRAPVGRSSSSWATRRISSGCSVGVPGIRHQAGRRLPAAPVRRVRADPGGLAAATLVAVWASDETSGRLEFLLATPLSRRPLAHVGLGRDPRRRGSLHRDPGGLGIAVGAMIAGGDIATPVVGSLVLGSYAAALAGIGVAIGGVFGTGYAAPASRSSPSSRGSSASSDPRSGCRTIGELALTSHYGFTMLGQWDVVGIVASVVLAVGGVAVGAWGFRRRDLRS